MFFFVVKSELYIPLQMLLSLFWFIWGETIRNPFFSKRNAKAEREREFFCGPVLLVCFCLMSGCSFLFYFSGGLWCCFSRFDCWICFLGFVAHDFFLGNAGGCVVGDNWNKVPNGPHVKWTFVPNYDDGILTFQKFIMN